MDGILLQTLERVKLYTDNKLAEVQANANPDLNAALIDLVVIITGGTRIAADQVKPIGK